MSSVSVGMLATHPTDARAPADTLFPERTLRPMNPVAPPSSVCGTDPESLPPFAAHCVRLSAERLNCMLEVAPSEGQRLNTTQPRTTVSRNAHELVFLTQSRPPCALVWQAVAGGRKYNPGQIHEVEKIVAEVTSQVRGSSP